MNPSTNSTINTTRIIIFAKAPRLGEVKTRLIPALGAAGAASLAQRMLAATLESALGARLGPVELCMTPAPGAAAWRGVALPAGIEISDQGGDDPGGDDLGARMARAAERSVDQGEPVLLIGTDCVEMSVALLRDASAALQASGAVIHCTADGGYALLGLTRFDARVFTGIPWSTSAVAAETLRRFEALGWPLHIGRLLHDVDEPQDLARLPPGWLPDGARDCDTLWPEKRGQSHCCPSYSGRLLV